jgi:organic hydroperoxide reductase OsmC/OhrA
MTQTTNAVHGTAQKSAGEFDIEIDQAQDCEFRIRFDRLHYPELLLDAPAPVGRDLAPSRLLAAAMGHCLASGLLYSARKARLSLGPIYAKVHTQIAPNEHGFRRVLQVEVETDPNVSEAEKEQAARCMESFEGFCIVTQSVREGIDVSV